MSTALDTPAPHKAGGQILLEALAFYRAAEALGMYGVANQFILVGWDAVQNKGDETAMRRFNSLKDFLLMDHAEKIVDMRKAGVQINPLVSRAARRKAQA